MVIPFFLKTISYSCGNTTGSDFTIYWFWQVTSLMLIWPDQSVWHIASTLNQITISTLPQSITHIWEITLLILNWILEFFQILLGLAAVLEIYLSACKPDQQYNCLCIELSFIWQVISPLPHRIKDTHLAFIYRWINKEYKGSETPLPWNYMPLSHVSIA